MRQQITSIVLAIVVVLAIVQFGPALLFGHEASRHEESRHKESLGKTCHLRDDRSAARPEGATPLFAVGASRSQLEGLVRHAGVWPPLT